MTHIEAIKVQKFLSSEEVTTHLEGVEYIILAKPSTRENPKHPIHFTIFLNTQDDLPNEVSDAVFEKFAQQYKISAVIDMLRGLEPVAFAKTNEDALMPMHLYQEEDAKNIGHGTMYIYDFEANAQDFKEPKDGLTGWTYSYN